VVELWYANKFNATDIAFYFIHGYNADVHPNNRTFVNTNVDILKAHLLLMTSLPEADRHRPLLSCAVFLITRLFICCNLSVSRVDEDGDLVINFRLTGYDGDSPPEGASSGN